MILDWVPAVLSVLMIALESTATMSAENTSQWLYPLWVRFLGPISAGHWNELHHLIRKTGHFVGYGLRECRLFLQLATDAIPHGRQTLDLVAASLGRGSAVHPAHRDYG